MLNAMSCHGKTLGAKSCPGKTYVPAGIFNQRSMRTTPSKRVVGVRRHVFLLRRWCRNQPICDWPRRRLVWPLTVSTTRYGVVAFRVGRSRANSLKLFNVTR